MNIPVVPTAESRLEAFSFVEQQIEFDTEVTKLIQELDSNARNQYISPENVLRYSHGERWLAYTQNQIDTERAFQQHGGVVTVKLEDIISHKVNLLHEFIHETFTTMHRLFMQTLFQTASDACDQTGNVVDAKKVGSPAAAFLEMLQKIQFGVDRKGQPVLPTVHLGNDAYQRMMQDLEVQGEDFKKKVAQITQTKREQALANEAKRRARFKTIE
jgi:hypothetical protein